MLKIAITTTPAVVTEDKSLRFIGYIFAAVTTLVILIAAAVVHAHIDGRLNANDANYGAIALAMPRVVR
jgi:hypothetical protein